MTLTTSLPVDLVYDLGFWAKYAHVDSAVLHTALRIGLFEALPVEGDVPLDVGELAIRLKASRRGTRVLCEPLTASGVLRADEQGRLAVPRAHAERLRQPAEAASLQEASRWWTSARELAPIIRGGSSEDRNGGSLLARYTQLFLEPGVSSSSYAADPLFDRAARNYLRTAALIAAMELGLFEILGQAWSTGEELAERCQSASGRLEVLLRTLATLHLVDVDPTAAAYRWSSAGWDHLAGRKLATFKQGLAIAASFWAALGQLGAAVLEDRRVLDLQDPAQSAAFYLALARYTTSVFPGYFKLATSVAATVESVRPLADAAILDVGAGSGVWGLAFSRWSPTCELTFLDHPQVLDQTRRNAEQLGLAQRARFWSADLVAADYGSGTHDVVLLGQICHTQPPEVLPDLFGRLARSLRPDGCLIIADSVLDERRGEPLEYLYFGVKEFTSTRGDVLSFPEYTRLLDAAGLSWVRLYRPGGVDVILASSAERTWPDELVSPRRATSEMVS